jgi:hypothetical protein
MELLSKGLKYNIHHKNKTWTETLALEAETAINQLDAVEQNYNRYAVAKNLKNISQRNSTTNEKNKNKN